MATSIDTLFNYRRPKKRTNIAGKRFALTSYLSRNQSTPPQADDAHDGEPVLNNIMPYYKFVTKYVCISNHSNKSQGNMTNATQHKTNNEPKQSKTRGKSGY